MTGWEMAVACFPQHRRHLHRDGVVLCETCWSLVPMVDTPDDHFVPTVDGLSPIQSAHVAWHLVTLEQS